MQPLRSIKIQTVSQNDPTKMWPRHDSTMSYCFWATVKVRIKDLRILFFAWISALIPPNQVYHTFSHKKCINPCFNSVCRTEKVMVYMPQRWQLKGSPNNLPPPPQEGTSNQRMFYGLKSSRRSFLKYLWKKKLKNESNVEECRDYQKMPISWELPI